LKGRFYDQVIMHHVAIMKKSWVFLPKILSGEKTIESRWYKTKRAPWGKIKEGDTVYFKNSGEPVIARSTVTRVLSFDNLTPKRIKQLLKKYARPLGIYKTDILTFCKILECQRYGILIFLKNPKKVKPFEIKKKGFGAMSAWLCIGDTERLDARH
jgi:ASC-1-like (ASCH) protein